MMGRIDVHVHGRTPFGTVLADVRGRVIEVTRTDLDRAEAEAARMGVSSIGLVVIDALDLRMLRAALTDRDAHLCLGAPACRALRRMP